MEPSLASERGAQLRAEVTRAADQCGLRPRRHQDRCLRPAQPAGRGGPPPARTGSCGACPFVSPALHERDGCHRRPPGPLRQQPVQPRREPPVGGAEQASSSRAPTPGAPASRRGTPRWPSRGRASSARVVAEPEADEDRHHDRGTARDRSRGDPDPPHHGGMVVAGAQILLAHPREQEDLVVH